MSNVLTISFTAVADTVDLTSDVSSCPSDGVSKVTFTVHVVDHAGTAVEGKAISLACSSGTVVVTAVNAVTDANGDASFTATDTVAESATFTATEA